MKSNQGDEYYGYNVPFFGGQGNVLSKQIGLRLIKNDLRQLLLTSPGERVNRPNFGTSIRSLVFEVVNSGDMEALRAEIIKTIETYETRISLTDIVVSSPDEKTIVIRVIGNLVNNPNVALDFEIPVRAQQ